MVLLGNREIVIVFVLTFFCWVESRLGNLNYICAHWYIGIRL